MLNPAYGVNSSDSAVIAATTEAAQAILDDGYALIVPNGIFKVNTLTVGDGAVIKGYSHAGTTVDDNHRSALRCTSGDLLTTDGTAHNVVVSDVELYCYGASGGDTVSGDWAFSRFERCSVIQGRDNKSAFNVTTWIGNHMPGTVVTHTLTSTVPTFNAVTAGGDINSSSFKEMVFVNNGSYAIHMEATGPAPLSLIDIEDVIFENPKGGAIKLLSAMNCNVDRVGLWDFTDAATAHLVVIGASSGPPAKNNSIKRYFRDATTAPGVGIKDISIQSGSADTSVTQSRHQAVGTAITVDFNSTTGEYEPNSGVVFEDVTAARAIGDTGWRKVVSWTAGVQDVSNQIGTVDASKYTLVGTGYLLMRRRGNTVTVFHPWQGSGNWIIPTTATGYESFVPTWPAGFRIPNNFGVQSTYVANQVCLINAQANSNGAPGFGWVDGNTSRHFSTASWEFSADEVWPTSLPGVAA